VKTANIITFISFSVNSDQKSYNYGQQQTCKWQHEHYFHCSVDY